MLVKIIFLAKFILVIQQALYLLAMPLEMFLIYFKLDKEGLAINLGSLTLAMPQELWMLVMEQQAINLVIKQASLIPGIRLEI